jgi:ribonuclease BN (tRNA processing enzyme)
MAIPVNHSSPAVGYQVASPDGSTVFYTGDCGPGLADCWQYISPRLLITEVTAPDSYEEFARKSGHLTPSLLKHELTVFQEVHGYLPQVVVVHMNPFLEKEIEAEIATVASTLGNSIKLGYEGMQLHL